MDNQVMNAETAAPESANEELIWKAHIVDAERFDGTLSEYCAQHGLRVRQFHRYRRKLGIVRPYRRRRDKAFVKVECVEAQVAEPKSVPSVALPDPAWLAEFVLAVLSRR
jgi:hypothetical protein